MCVYNWFNLPTLIKGLIGEIFFNLSYTFDMKYQDLIYFGHDGSADESEFIEEITEKFPNCKLVDMYDEFKGYRQEVWLDDNDSEDDYWAWIIAHQWFGSSLCGTLMDLGGDSDQHAKLTYYINLAKEQYPERIIS